MTSRLQFCRIGSFHSGRRCFSLEMGFLVGGGLVWSQADYVDMSAARHADVLFVKNDKPPGENDLAAYCEKEGIGHVLFRWVGCMHAYWADLCRTFADALPVVRDVVEGRKTPAEVL